jgi:peptide/nickel transport system permease protein
MVGLAVVVLLFALAYLSPYLAPWRYDQLDFNAFLEPPGGSHWFGTTQNGFDMFALTMRGMQKSLVIGLLGAVMATALAATVGAFAGYFGGVVNTVLVTVIDLLMVLPAFLIIAILSPTFRGRTWLIFVLLLAAFQWMVTARIVRGMTLSLREREFVHAARFMGVPGWRIIFRHILPNMASLLIIDATINVSSLILAEVGLSFFGFGVQPPDVSLGTLIGNYAGAALTFPWEFYFPAVLLIVLVLAINLVGDGLRDAFDPNSQGRAI